MISRNADRSPETKARQGVTGHGVRYVLAISLGVSALALFALFLFFRLTESAAFRFTP